MANGNESMGPSHKEVGTITPRCVLLKAFQKEKRKKKKKKTNFTDRTLLIIQFGLKYMSTGNRLGNISSSNLQDEAPTPLPVVGPLFISPLSFHLSRALLGAWHFGLFRSVYSSFHNKLDHIREPVFYWVFYFIFLISVFVSSYVKMKKFCSF